MKSSKMQFKENTDFKDLDKQFHPLSSSGFAWMVLKAKCIEKYIEWLLIVW